jgi:hypothetical protein
VDEHGPFGGCIRVLCDFTGEFEIVGDNASQEFDTLEFIIGEFVHFLDEIVRVELDFDFIKGSYFLPGRNELNTKYSLLSNLREWIIDSNFFANWNGVDFMISDFLVSSVLKLVVRSHRLDKVVVDISGFVHRADGEHVLETGLDGVGIDAVG